MDKEYVAAISNFVAEWGLTFKDKQGSKAVHEWCQWRHENRDSWKPSNLITGFDNADFVPDVDKRRMAMISIEYKTYWFPTGNTRMGPSESRQSARDRILKDIGEKVTEELDRIESAYGAVGFDVEPTFSKDSEEVKRHLNWLFLYQAKKYSIENIARQFHKSRQTVAPAIKGMANRMELTLRKPGKAGRKRKK